MNDKHFSGCSCCFEEEEATTGSKPTAVKNWRRFHRRNSRAAAEQEDEVETEKERLVEALVGTETEGLDAAAGQHETTEESFLLVSKEMAVVMAVQEEKEEEDDCGTLAQAILVSFGSERSERNAKNWGDCPVIPLWFHTVGLL